MGSVGVAPRLNCPEACEIFPDQGSNLCPLHWQADSTPGPPGKAQYLFLLVCGDTVLEGRALTLFPISPVAVAYAQTAVTLGMSGQSWLCLSRHTTHV